MTKTTRDFPYNFILPKMDSQWAASAWCTEKFGERWSVIDNRKGVWCCFWRGRNQPGSYEWYFQNEDDATLFLLRWS